MFMPSSLGMAPPRALLDPVDESVFYPVDPNLATLVVGNDAETVGLNVGMVFTVQVNSAVIHSLCYFRADAAMSASGTLALWQISDPPGDVMLASAAFTGHSGTGWRVVPLASPVAVSTSKGYIAHLWMPSDGTRVRYGATLGYWVSGGHLSTPWGFLNGVPSNGQGDTRGFVKRNGMYGYGAFARPSLYTHANYWVDVISNARPTPIPPDPPLVLKWPILDGFPTPETTGANDSTVFTVENENVGSTADGQIIENMDFRDGVYIQHNNVTLRNCKIRSPFGHIVYVLPGTDGTIVEDCTVDGVGKNNLGVNGITVGGTNATIRRNKVYRQENHIAILGDEVAGLLIEDNLLYNLRAGPGGPPHYDCIQFGATMTGTVVRHNTVYNEHGDTATIMLPNDGGGSDDTLIEDNYLCGAGYTCYVDDRFNPSLPITNVRYFNNKLRMGTYGYFAIAVENSPLPLFEGNQYLTHGGIYDAPPPTTGFVDGQSVPESFWGLVTNATGSVTGEAVTSDVGGITLGMSFTPLVDGEITGVNFYRPNASSTIHHKIGVWRYTGSNPDAGVELLATQEFPNVIKTGLTFLELTTPVPVTALQNYLVAVWMPRGSDGKVWYIQQGGVFWPNPVLSQWERMMAFSNNPATPYNGFTGRNNTYAYGSDLVPPLTSTDTDPRYWIEPVFVAPWAAEEIVHGAVNVTLEAATLAGTGTVTAPLPGTASLVVVLGAATLVATGELALPPARTGTLTLTLDAATLAATGTTVAPSPIAGTLATTLAPATLVAMGIAIPSPRIGTLAVTLRAATLAAIAVNNPDTALGNASNTGVPPGTVLTNSGGITTTSNGQIIQDKNVSGTIVVNHANVIIRRCRVTVGSDDYGIACYSSGAGAGPLIEDCEIIGTRGNCGISGNGIWRRVNIHGFENGINVTGSNGKLMNSWLHGMDGNDATAHYDTVQIDGSISNWEIGYCTLENLKDDTSCVMIDNGYGGIDNIDVHDCVMIGGGGYTVYSDEQLAGPGWSGEQITNIKFRNNRMDSGFYGYHLFRNNTPVFTGNTDRLTGAPLT